MAPVQTRVQAVGVGTTASLLAPFAFGRMISHASRKVLINNEATQNSLIIRVDGTYFGIF